ncbi:hypothetical protein [Nakamurella sp. GG22]
MRDGQGDDPEAQTLAGLLADLADDPEAPPSTVTAASVIAAARAGQAGQSERPADDAPRRGLRVIGGGAAGTPRRRTGLIALVAAASVAAVAAVVIPLTLNTGATNTSALGGREAAADSQSATAPTEAAMQAAPAPPAADLSAPAASDVGSGSAHSGSANSGDASSGRANSDAAGSAAGSAEAQPDAAEPGSTTAESCWPALSPTAAAALTSALPAGAFGKPQPLLQDCGADPVAGASLPGTGPGTELVVRVSKAAAGACARASGEAVSRCVAAGDGQSAEGEYVGTDAAGTVTAFAYGDGFEVAVGGPTASAGVPAAPTGLTTAQLQSAAGALLDAIG